MGRGWGEQLIYQHPTTTTVTFSILSFIFSNLYFLFCLQNYNHNVCNIEIKCLFILSEILSLWNFFLRKGLKGFIHQPDLKSIQSLSANLVFCSMPVCVLSRVPCLTLCDPMDCSLPRSSVHEISQARILEWVAISYSRGSSQPRSRTHIFYSSYTGSEILRH